jgi:hypothetical protein
MPSSATENLIEEYRNHRKKHLLITLTILFILLLVFLFGIGLQYSSDEQLVQKGIIVSTFYVQPTDNGSRPSVRLSVKLNSGQFVSVIANSKNIYKKGDSIKVSSRENYFGLIKHSIYQPSNNGI